MQSQSFNKFLLGAIIVTVAVLLAGSIIFSTQVNAQSAGVSTMSSGATMCGGGGGGECDDCSKIE
jgi:outer membrane murein-binding lipoprotein Lpp